MRGEGEGRAMGGVEERRKEGEEGKGEGRAWGGEKEGRGEGGTVKYVA